MKSVLILSAMLAAVLSITGAEPIAIASTGDVTVGTTLTLSAGATVDEISTDGTMAGDSDSAVPTEKAVKAYVDSKVSAEPSVLLKAEVSGGDISIDNGPGEVVDFTSQPIQTHPGKFDANGEVWTVPEDGIYFVTCSLSMDDLDSGSYLQVIIEAKETSTSSWSKKVRALNGRKNAANQDLTTTCSSLLKLYKDGAIRVQAQHNDPGGRNLVAGAFSHLSIMRMGPIP